MTVPILQYVRERRYSQASIPDGQLALWDIVFELARRVDALESGAAQNGSGKADDQVAATPFDRYLAIYLQLKTVSALVHAESATDDEYVAYHFGKAVDALSALLYHNSAVLQHYARKETEGKEAQP